MNKAIQTFRLFLPFAIPAFLFAVIVILFRSPLLYSHSLLNFAIAVDMLLLIPLIYFLLIRKTKIPKTSVVPVMVVGLLIGTFFLPAEKQFFFSVFKKWILPFIELTIITFVIIKVRKAISIYQSNSSRTIDFYSNLKSVCYKILPKPLVLPFATEVAVFYYALINWKSHRLKPNEFTYHKNSGTPALFGAVIFIIAIETLAFHFLIQRWSITTSWVLTGLSVYTLVQVLAFARSFSHRPITIIDNSLTIRFGIMSEVEIPLIEIAHIELSQRDVNLNKTTRKLFPLENHNVIITLKRPHVLTGLYGLKKSFETLALHVDESNNFINSINSKINQN